MEQHCYSRVDAGRLRMSAAGQLSVPAVNKINLIGWEK